MSYDSYFLLTPALVIPLSVFNSQGEKITIHTDKAKFLFTAVNILVKRFVYITSADNSIRLGNGKSLRYISLYLCDIARLQSRSPSIDVFVSVTHLFTENELMTSSDQLTGKRYWPNAS